MGFNLKLRPSLVPYMTLWDASRSILTYGTKRTTTFKADVDLHQCCCIQIKNLQCLSTAVAASQSDACYHPRIVAVGRAGSRTDGAQPEGQCISAEADGPAASINHGGAIRVTLIRAGATPSADRTFLPFKPSRKDPSGTVESCLVIPHPVFL